AGLDQLPIAGVADVLGVVDVQRAAAEEIGAGAAAAERVAADIEVPSARGADGVGAVGLAERAHAGASDELVVGDAQDAGDERVAAGGDRLLADAQAIGIEDVVSGDGVAAAGLDKGADAAGADAHVAGDVESAVDQVVGPVDACAFGDVQVGRRMD